MIKAVLFDMDGVLVDSEPLITKSAIEALKSFGVEACAEDFKEFTGMGENKFIGGVAEKHGVEFVPEMKKLTYDIYERTAGDSGLIKVYNKIPELIDYLKKKGYKVAVCSSADLRKVKINLKSAGVPFEWFDAVLSAEDVVKKKPDPAIFLAGAAKVCEKPEDCIVVEDAVMGVKAGVAAGCRVYAVDTSFDKQTLLDAGAVAVLKEAAEIMQIL